jgi:eukaryotic-like serine/threonine-protein kinase
MNRFSPEAALTPPRDSLIGSVLQGRYRVLRRIGKGGMGVVYLAEHVLIRRKVAIKTLHANPPPPLAMVERFHREALAATAVGDQHVVDVTDMGQLDDGCGYYLVMEYLEGADLAFTLASEGPLPIARAVRIVLQLCDALTAVHGAGIVHRDLKPENLFLIERGGVRDFVKVLDFGVCKLTQPQDMSFHRLTGTGAALGTPHFMAPEQIEGRADVDHRADLYAVGGILFQMLTGDAPFDAPSLPRLFMRICSDPPPRLRELRAEVPEGLEAIVDRTLAKDPGDRYASSEELKRALLPFAELAEPARPTEPAGPRPARPPEVTDTPMPANVTDLEWVTLEGRRRWPLRALVAGLVLATVALGVGLWSAYGGAAEDAPKAEPSVAEEAQPRVQARAKAAALDLTATRAEPATEAAAPPAAEAAAPRVRARRKPASSAAPAASAVSERESESEPAAAPAAPAAAEPSVPAPVPDKAASPGADPLLPPRELKHVF